ncbi:MAG: biotin transporter BioY [Alkaliphilus sp.]|nr:biotin transporter BioY [bacterium AH-315-L21]MBN4067571.1 biotin transporter BioY [Alkaliphilus transvaalensis]PHS33866.1 MAG: biotin transporter BioY [Alkaliphilus sp.]
MKLSIRNMSVCSLFAALTAVFAQIAIPLPFSPVPFTLQVIAVLLSGALLGSKLGALSQIVYLLLGAVGMPVFSQFTAGLGILIGPTGGYLIAFPVASYLIGFIVERKTTRGAGSLASFIIVNSLAMLLGVFAIFSIGVVQLKFVASLTWDLAFKFGVFPFILPDLVKIAIAILLVHSLKKVLSKQSFSPKKNSL